MDHQEILPKRKRVDTIAQVADESQENPQNEGLPNINVNHEWEEAQFGIPLQLSDDADSEVLFWGGQKTGANSTWCLSDGDAEKVLQPKLPVYGGVSEGVIS